MTKPAIRVEALPAGYGDCLLVSCPIPGGTWRMLIDTGPDETWPALRRRLLRIPPDAAGRRRIDLAIVSHIDHDHIGGARFLFADDSLSLTFGDVWFNGRQHLERGVAEAAGLSALLSATSRPLPWNAAFGGAAAATLEERLAREVDMPAGCPRITLLTPTPVRLSRLAPIWDAEIEKLRQGQSNAEEERDAAPGEFPDLDRLAARDTRLDASPTNASSIAILLEHRGASALLAADAWPVDLTIGLLAVARERGQSLPLRVDVFKLGHHGSRANLIQETLATIRADHYLVSTNNHRFGHPNDEALARIVKWGGNAPTLSFNYATKRNLRWADAALQEKYGFSSRFPKNARVGVAVDCPLRAANVVSH